MTSVQSPSTGYRPASVTHEEPKHSRFFELATGAPGVIVGAVLGAGIGIALQQAGASEDVVSWMALPGDLFIRALKCLVTPLVFCSLITGMADLLNVGKASVIGWRSALVYTTTTVIASIEGLLWVMVFRSQFSNKKGKEVNKQLDMAFKCDNGMYMTQNGTDVTCTGTNAEGLSKFLAVDINSVFKTSAARFVQLSLSEALQAQLRQMVPDNITKAFADANLLSVVMFSIPFGIVVASLPKSKSGENRVLELFRLLNQCFMRLIHGAIIITPIAVFFLISGALAKQEDLVGLVKDVSMLILTVVLGLSTHVFIFLPALLGAVIKANPFSYLRYMFPAQVFALGCASSMATLPVTIKCVDASRQVSSALSRFVLSLGATINMDGSALYYPAAVVFMAETAGMGSQVGGVEMFLIVIVSTVGAVGAAPVPSAGMVMVITIWNSVFPSTPLPDSFSYILAIDWLLDRFRTCTNVTGDTVVARVIAQMVDETTVDEERQSMVSLYDEGYLMEKPELQHELDDQVRNKH